MNASRQIGQGSMTVLSSDAPASASNSCVYCGGTSSLSELPFSGTNAFQNTSRRRRSGICSATFAMIVPPKLWPTRTTSDRSRSTIASTIERTQSSCVTALSAPLPCPAIVGVSTLCPSSRRRSATGPQSEPSCHEPWTRTKRYSDMGGSSTVVRVRGERRARDDQLLDLRRALVDAQRAHLAIEPLYDASDRDTEAAEQLDGVIDHPLRGLGRVQLGHRRLAGDAPAGDVVRPRGAVDEQRRRVHVQRHPAQLRLHELQVGHRRAEQLALARAGQRLVERAAGEAEGGGADRRAEDVERRHRDLEALPRRAEALRRRHADAVELEARERV